MLLCQKASNALPDNEFVETEIKLPAGLVRKCGSGDAGCMQACNSIQFYKRLLAIASYDAPTKFTGNPQALLICGLKDQAESVHKYLEGSSCLEAERMFWHYAKDVIVPSNL